MILCFIDSTTLCPFRNPLTAKTINKDKNIEKNNINNKSSIMSPLTLLIYCVYLVNVYRRFTVANLMDLQGRSKTWEYSFQEDNILVS
jgi:hypothetical protein